MLLNSRQFPQVELNPYQILYGGKHDIFTAFCRLHLAWVILVWYQGAVFNFKFDPAWSMISSCTLKQLLLVYFLCSAINIPSTCFVYHHCVCIMGNPNLHANLEGMLNRTNSWANNLFSICLMFFHQFCWLSSKILCFTTHHLVLFSPSPC